MLLVFVTGSQTRAPWVVTVSTKVNATVGGSAILECLADGIPNLQISWQKISEWDFSLDHRLKDSKYVLVFEKTNFNRKQYSKL